MMLFLTLGMTLSFSSCGDDDDEDDNVVLTDDKTTNNNNQSSSTGGSNSGSSYTECRYCDGSGECPGSNCNNGRCIRCGGKGYTYSGKYKTSCAWCNNGKCIACHGTAKCPKCHGTGHM